MTFAALEDRVNLAATTRLTNCTATVATLAVNGIFSDGYADAFGMDGGQPALSCRTSDVSTAVRGTAVVVNGVNYTVASAEKADAGMTKLKLEKV